MKRGLFRGIKNDVHMCLTHKYKNTNTHIHKYTNTAYDKLPERPNMWHVFEEAIIQGYLLSLVCLVLHYSNQICQYFSCTGTIFAPCPEFSHKRGSIKVAYFASTPWGSPLPSQYLSSSIEIKTNTETDAFCKIFQFWRGILYGGGA